MPTRREFMAMASAALQRSASTPNIIVIFCDDLGSGDLGCYGGALATPNLDRMAREGLRFTNAISANPVCSPSRAGLMTGRYPTRVGVPRVFFPRDQVGLNLDEVTVANVLKDKGYRTACVGKWHLGHLPQYLPTSRGFDSYFGIPYSNDMKPAVVLDGKETVEAEATQDTLTDRYTQRAVKFIEDSNSAPFFLYFPHTFPHIPLYASKKFRGKSPHGLYGDVIAEIDWSVGEIFATLKRRKLEDSTLVLFSSDNGPWFQGSAGRYRNRKGSAFEGGVRVPLLAWQKRKIKPGVNDSLVSLMDVMPTVSAMCGATPPKKTDGVDISPILRGARTAVERDLLLYFDDWNLQCVRKDDWKLHLSRYNTLAYSPAPQAGKLCLPLKNPELYNLKTDIAESYDIAAEHPDVVRELKSKAEAMLREFPEPVWKNYTEMMARPATNPPAGSLPQKAAL